MGGDGASSGISKKGHKYGTDYKTVFKKGNIKFVKATSNKSEELLETMTRGRVYVLVNGRNQLKSIIYFDKNNKKSKSIDLTHKHNGKIPHTHHGYAHGEKGTTGTTDIENKLIDKIKKIWYNKNR